MEMCRACLSTDSNMLPLDEVLIAKYNLLTNLNVAMTDGLPHLICRNCSETVNHFIAFREKSTVSETTLRQILYTDVKKENYPLNIDDAINENIIKQEIIDEIKNEDAISDDEYELHEEYQYLVEVKSGLINSKDSISKRCKEEIKVSKKLESKPKIKGCPKIKEEDETNLFCGICTKVFENNDELKKHLESHKNSKHCQQCDEMFDGWSQVLGHRLIHIPRKQKRCHICMKRFVSCVYLEYHYRSQHVREEGTKLRCKQCNTFYDNPRKFKKHMWSIHGNKNYVCDYCSKRYNSKTVLRKHILIHMGTKNYICDICGFKSNFIGGLKDHKIRRHTATKVYCKVCDRPFQNQQDHDKHKCQKKIVMCPVCGLQFSRNMKLSRHMNVHTNIPKYECNRCPAKFKSSYSLKAHQDRHDGNRTKHCEFCPAKFFTGSSLIKHRRIHTGNSYKISHHIGSGVGSIVAL
ncbi:hypothetical protein O3G_MSEX007979 [Manduca sexta]|uniref:Uncharacterized protein n=2 Tax=Manduca sexta TaxID=7130 RepID=A0A921ZA96_MANSE|nr:hypothetical protein O3G_MSEX007979 [Manduca sexta]